MFVKVCLTMMHTCMGTRCAQAVALSSVLPVAGFEMRGSLTAFETAQSRILSKFLHRWIVLKSEKGISLPGIQ